MITKIHSIKKFGVFDEFAWGALPDFSRKNILYGWNYSGKTTLSRVFSCVEHKKIHEDYINANYKIELTGEAINEYTHENLNDYTTTVRVFNEDFKERNIKWNGKEFNPILLLGEESIETQAEIDKLKSIVQSDIVKKETCSTRAQEAKNDYENRLSNRASEIKLVLGLSNFTKAHFKPIVDGMLANHTANIIVGDETIAATLNNAASNDKLDELAPLKIDLKYSNLHSRTVALLKSIPKATAVIKKLEDNPNIAKWVSDGLELNKPNTNCEFCGNLFSDQRLNELQNHFSEEYNLLITQLKTLQNEVIEAKIKFVGHDKTRFYKSLQTEQEKVLQELEADIDIYNKTLDALYNAIDSKTVKIFNELVLEEIVDVTVKLSTKISEYQSIIDKNNLITEEFETTKTNALNSLKLHYASEFITSSEYIKLKKQERVYTSGKDRYEKLIATNTDKIETLEANISTAHKGKEELNSFINTFLGGDNIKIGVHTNEDGNERFIIKRGEELAKNLSEGEKSAIAFSYYLIKLKEKPLGETIVYIDDPISSLDSNHIYHVYHLINSYFFFFDEAEGASGAYKTTCKQLFISTHNFELFSLLKKLPHNKQFAKSQYYQVIRKDEANSTVVELNKLFLDFESEYNYLFSLILEQALASPEDGEKQPQFLLLPNAIRKFLETYTLAKIPIALGVDKRATQLFGAKATEVIKFLHHHSHHEKVDGIGHHDSSIFNLNKVSKELVGWLEEEDKMHFDALKSNLVTE